ncbi:MAG: 2-amino-4-hydroxy-6-hydroxymethyldihydropteridine diphosphokinase [Gemmataceae bacterium]
MAATTAYIALGSNEGDRKKSLDRALAEITVAPGVRLVRVSQYYETDPEAGPAGQGLFLNAVAELQTELPAGALLEKLLSVEKSLGRVRGERNAPRTIDIDLLLFGDLISSDAKLTVPHPRLHARLFVLDPFAEIAPDLVHPVLGTTIQVLRDRVRWLKQIGQISGRELTGKRALVTGSTSGIGRAIALDLATAGADVIVHGRRKKAGEEVAAEVQDHGCRSQVLLGDLTQPEQRTNLVNEAWKAWGGLDIWINNAGADTLTGATASWSFERKLQELLEVDVTATIILAREVGGRMQSQGQGVIINIGWDQSDTGMAGDSGQLFGASKGAVMAFSKSLAMTLAPKVRVNCIAPGWIQTAWGRGASAAWQERVLRETPLQRWGTPADVAATARWLVAPAASYITGQVVYVNGGAVR